MGRMARHVGRVGISGVVVGRLPAPAGFPEYVRISEFSLLLDDHGMFQSMQVTKCSYLRVFDVPKGPGGWEGRIRGGDDICLDVNQPKHLLYVPHVLRPVEG